MRVNVNQVRAELDQARREWEEMEVSATSYAMRHKAENRVLSLAAVLRSAEAPVAVLGSTPPRTAAGWRRLAVAGGR